MKCINCFPITTFFLSLVLSTTISADGFIKKEVYSYKDVRGNLVFTDKKPTIEKTFKTRIVESANSTGHTQTKQTLPSNSTNQNYRDSTQTIRIIVDSQSTIKQDTYKKKNNLKRCKSFKKKLDYYNDKMNSGYKNSEYKTLESNRKKYRNLLFNNCETKNFNE